MVIFISFALYSCLKIKEMLLAQPFDPFNNEQAQQKKLPFFTRCRFISQRTKRVLCNLKNRAHTARGFQTMMLPNNRFMLTPPPPQPQPWYCSYGGCYDPYLMLGPLPPLPPPPHPMHFPPMPSHQSMPYSICVHLTSSCPIDNCNNQPQCNNKGRQNQQSHKDNSSFTDSTLYSSSSSLFNDEKEQIDYEQDDYNVRRRRIRSGSNITATPSILTRSNSDILHDRHQQHQQRRPYMQHRWSNQNDAYYYE